MDISGQSHLDVSHTVYKEKLDKDGKVVGDAEQHDLHGREGGKKEELYDKDGKLIDLKDAATKHLDPKYCGSCYGAEAEKGVSCCNTCNDVRDAYRVKGWALMNPEGIEQCMREGFVQELKEMGEGGCRVFGYVEVSKVAGNFHFAPGKSFQQSNMHVHDLMNFDVTKFNVSHTVNDLSFGLPFPGSVNPLQGKVQTVGVNDVPSSGMYQYFVKIVPTSYQALDGALLKTNQFSVTYHFRELDQSVGRGLPGVFVFYDLSPIMCTFQETHRSLSNFLTSVCAIVGGIFTVSGMIDRIMYRGTEVIKKKMSVGKFS